MKAAIRAADGNEELRNILRDAADLVSRMVEDGTGVCSLLCPANRVNRHA